MISVFTKRLAREDRGFTLIELMVVVLIIAILIAIAIPTFLGARKRAQARAAQATVKNIHTASRVVFSDNESYPTTAGTMLDLLSKSEPSICVTDGTANANPNDDCTATASQGANGVYFKVVDAQTIQIGAYSKSGVCYFLQDKSGPGTTGLGTKYSKLDVTTLVCGATELAAAPAFTSDGWK